MAQIISGLSSQFDPTAFGVGNASAKLITPSGEPARGYLWEISITGPNPGTSSSNSGKLGGILNNVIQNVENKVSNYFANGTRNDIIVPTLNYYAKSLSIPETAVEVIEDNYMGDKYMFPGKVNSAKSANITFWDDQHFTVFGYMQTWINELKSANSFMGRQMPKPQCVRDIMIDLKDTSNLFTILRITLKNCLISTLNDVTLDYDTTEPLTVTANFVFDDKVVGVYQKETPGLTT